jgi:hypothetical protein
MLSLVATFLTLWAGSVFNDFPQCVDSEASSGSRTLAWCNVLSVTVGIVDLMVVVVIVMSFVWMKTRRMRGVEELQSEVESHVRDGIELRQWTVPVNPLHSLTSGTRGGRRISDV